MISKCTAREGGLISPLGVETWRPRRIGIAGVRFNSGGDPAPEQNTAEGGEPKKADAEAGKEKPADKPAEKKPDEQPIDKGKAGDTPKAPDTYELTIPDEAKTAVGDHVADIQREVEDDAKANGWTNEEAQGELTYRLGRASERLTQLREGWLAQTKADPTYGGDKLEATQTAARRVVEAIRPNGHPRRDAFLALLNGSGIGNHLEVVSFLADLGAQMGEDSPTLGKSPGKTDPVKRTEDVLFPSSAKA